MSRRFQVSDLPDEPLVSVIIPSYNHAPYVEQAVRSVLDQTYPRVELIVVDDGSTDESWTILQRLQSEFGFQIFRQANQGICATLNFAVRHSQGQVLTILASDDWYSPEKLSRQVEFFVSSSANTGLIHSAAYKVYGDGDVIETHGQYRPAQGSCLKELITFDAQILACSIMFPRAIWEEVGGFDETLKTEDVAFFTAITAHGYEIRYDPRPLVYKRETDAGLGGNTRACADSQLAILERYRSFFQPDEFRAATSIVQAGEGRAWSAALQFGNAWRCYVAAARTRGSPLPLVSFAGNALRDLARHAAPVDLRASIRRLRARAAKAS